MKEKTLRPYVYHVSYMYQTRGGLGYGDMTITSKYKIADKKTISETRETIFGEMDPREMFNPTPLGIIIVGITLLDQPKLTLPGMRKQPRRSMTRRMQYAQRKAGTK